MNLNWRRWMRRGGGNGDGGWFACLFRHHPCRSILVPETIHFPSTNAACANHKPVAGEGSRKRRLNHRNPRPFCVALNHREWNGIKRESHTNIGLAGHDRTDVLKRLLYLNKIQTICLIGIV